MELRQLKYFVTVARTLNFSDAARQLFITQGTLSQQIKQLEDEMGSQLFERTSHSVALTDAGEELLPYAIRTLEASKDCKNRMNDIKGTLTGTLNIGVTYSFSTFLTDAVKNFLKANPEVKLNIYYKTASELIDMLHDDMLDLILCFKPYQQYDDMDSEVLFRSKMNVIMRKGHPLSTRKEISMQDLEGYGFVLPGSGMQSRRVFDRFNNIDTRRLDVRIELNDPNLIMDLVQSTNLISMTSTLAIYYRSNTLVAIPLEGAPHEMLGCVHTLKAGYKKRAATAFIDLLRDSAFVARAGQR